MSDNKKEWFAQWFNSPYYHILYNKRDTKEAQGFIDKLSDYLSLSDTDLIMDLACGKGRHAIYLNQKGFNVTGLDLSEKNIEAAKKFENEKLLFYVHDMRDVFKPISFDYVLNLFTSFGYFDDDADNQLAITSAAAALKEQGTLVLDFLNPQKVVDQLVPQETKVVQGITFHIEKKISNNFIVKEIRFSDQGKDYRYYEKVRAISYAQFSNYFGEAGMEIRAVFGDYELNPYTEHSSERMIFVVRKKA